MKNFLPAILLLGSMALAPGADPPYQSKTATGSTAAQVIFPADPGRQVRVVGVVATSDKAASVLSFRTGTTPYSISLSNAAGTTITVTRTNGLAPNDVIVIQRADGSTNVSGTISSFPASTNITLAATTGIVTLPGDQVYKLGNPIAIKCGATTVSYQGEGVYAGDPGRPVRCVLDGTSACTIDSITARYQ